MEINTLTMIQKNNVLINYCEVKIKVVGHFLVHCGVYHIIRMSKVYNNDVYNTTLSIKSNIKYMHLLF